MHDTYEDLPREDLPRRDASLVPHLGASAVYRSGFVPIPRVSASEMFDTIGEGRGLRFFAEEGAVIVSFSVGARALTAARTSAGRGVIMITVDTPRCKVARPCCWLLSGHADARPIGRKKWHDLHRCMLAAMVHPSRPSVPARPGAALPLINQHRRRRVRSSNPHSASRTLTVPSRDFLHWPFAYAGRRCMPRRRHGRHAQTFTLADIEPAVRCDRILAVSKC
jgi:hypothetical protein